jgi:DNA-binding NarL/FixJ family response regulator
MLRANGFSGHDERKADTPSGSDVIRVLILARRHLYSTALAQLLSGKEGLRVVGMVSDLAGAMHCLGHLSADVLLLDMGSGNSAAVVRTIAEAAPGVRVVAFEVSADERKLVACAKARVAGYVSPEEDPEDLVITIRSVARGEMRCSPRTAQAVLDRVAALAVEGAPEMVDIPLTTRELEVLKLIDVGLSNKEIARRLSIELATVKNHVHNILAKLKVNRRTEAVARLRHRELPEYPASDLPALPSSGASGTRHVREVRG